jgi:SAM-dependent methyltransferase
MSIERTRSGSLSASYFEAKYQADIDPWRFRTSAYERDKYQATMAALTRPRYRRGFEAGCAIGVLSAQLTARCDQLLAVDASPTAIAEAARQDLPHVHFTTAVLPDDFPDGRFDLIILSELLYYFVKADLACLAEKCVAAMKDGGEMILCHWLGETNHPLIGLEANDVFVTAIATRRPARVILHDDIYSLERLVFAAIDAAE